MSSRLSWAPDSSERAADVLLEGALRIHHRHGRRRALRLGLLLDDAVHELLVLRGHVALLLGVGAVADAVLDVHARHERGLFHAVCAVGVEDDRALLARRARLVRLTLNTWSWAVGGGNSSS